MSERHERYHLIAKGGRRGDKKRTTVSIDWYIAVAMAIRFGKEPGTSEAHGAIRDWLQERVEKNGGWGDSFWLQKEMFFEIVDKALYKKMHEAMELMDEG